MEIGLNTALFLNGSVVPICEALEFPVLSEEVLRSVFEVFDTEKYSTQLGCHLFQGVLPDVAVQMQ